MLPYKEVGFRYLPGQAAPFSGALQQAYIHIYIQSHPHIVPDLANQA